MKQSLPVIIGTGLSGTAISRALSTAGRPHVLIGPRPRAVPTLGESISVEGSIELAGALPSLRKFYHPKKAAVVYLPDTVVAFDLEFGSILKCFPRILGYDPPTESVHLDRIGFDSALFESAVREPLCNYVNANVVDIEHDTSLDTITAIRLSDQCTLMPAFVFDCTNHVRLTARALELGVSYLGPSQRVVWTHYRLPCNANPPTAGQKWQHWTNLCRLCAASDGIDGFAWCIPLGDTASVGVSVDESARLSDDRLLAIIKKAYASRGIHYRSIYTETTTTCSLRHRYFVHERAYGANWLLVGPSFCQIWYMSGSGVGTSLTGARVALQFIEAPTKIGQRYEAYMMELLRSHAVLDWFVNADIDAMTEAATRMHADGLVKSNLQRLLRYIQIGQNSVAALAIGTSHRLLHLLPAQTGYCDVVTAVRGEQLRVICRQ